MSKKRCGRLFGNSCFLGGQRLLSAFRASSGSNGTAGCSGWSVPPFAVDLIRFPWTTPSHAGFTMGLPEFCACGEPRMPSASGILKNSGHTPLVFHYCAQILGSFHSKLTSVLLQGYSCQGMNSILLKRRGAGIGTSWQSR